MATQRAVLRAAAALEAEIRALGSAERAVKARRYFRASYTPAHEEFTGTSMPKLRELAIRRPVEDPDLMDALFASKTHEVRMFGALAIVRQFELRRRAKDRDGCRQWFDQFIRLAVEEERVNNWDLVDVSAHKVAGQFLLDCDDEAAAISTLLQWSDKSQHIWARRVACLATWPFTKTKRLDPILQVSRRLLDQGEPEELIGMAAGWMLREAWKRDAMSIETFVEANAARFPRKMLRYAIEKLPKARRQDILQTSLVESRRGIKRRRKTEPI